jgi:hypothetical protein
MIETKFKDHACKKVCVNLIIIIFHKERLGLYIDDFSQFGLRSIVIG